MFPLQLFAAYVGNNECVKFALFHCLRKKSKREKQIKRLAKKNSRDFVIQLERIRSKPKQYPDSLTNTFVRFATAIRTGF